jgi:hypothetical protein
MVTSSSAWRRQQSSPCTSRWLIIIGVIFWIIFSVHAPIGYQTNPVECTPPFGSNYELFVSIESIITSIATMLIMSVFSVLTVLNVRSRINRQVHPAATNLSILIETQQTMMSNAESSRKLLKKNIQLVRLSLLQVIIYLLLNSVWSIIPLYSFSVGAQAMMTINQQMMVLFLGRIGLNLIFTYAAVRFFLYFFFLKPIRIFLIVYL